MLKVGSCLGGYEILEVMGHGASSATYRARHRDGSRGPGQELVLKVPHEATLGDATFVIRFLQEGALGSTLNHPGIVRVLEAGEEDGRLYLAMEMVRGVSLARRLEEQGPVDLRTGLRIARAVASALAHAHRHHVVHRNLKPSHVMLLPNERVKVMDFGVARAFGEVGLTSADVFLGTPAYAAPEAVDPHSVDARSDLYSLGIILFEMLEGAPPFTADSAVELMLMHQENHFPRLEELEAPVPRAVWNLMDSLCGKLPEHRPADAQLVVDKLDRLLRTAAVGG